MCCLRGDLGENASRSKLYKQKHYRLETKTPFSFDKINMQNQMLILTYFLESVCDHSVTSGYFKSSLVTFSLKELDCLDG